ncbi:two-component system, response regulator YesN [Lacrimispora sphenoides]|jgi:two-component system response regulator YesN|uniref:helix-turn-helix domain-containing protein n=1 Tax=Lacrimispora sphenoides TaxID=29370 RepID=UPI0008B7DA12|nr:helix-turn-helix domain-containing protein [Lacrimispora sphenoides]SET44184.1 two-component system, response regulator YesN [Lacrimispora sphenoides]
MKLLIVDDEELTRTGLIDSIDWESLGVFQLFQAEDGISGLRIAKDVKPEIVLCDVRMPRMDGIEMVERLEKLLPHSAFIFMSGYSDKEYLKAAIRLKAINYVEKPLDPAEVKNSIKEAYNCVRQNMRTVKNELFYSRGTASSFAAALTQPYRDNKETVAALAKELGLKLTPHAGFTSFVVKLEQSQTDQNLMDQVLTDLEVFLSHSHMQVYYVSKYIQYHVFHILSPVLPSYGALNRIGVFLKNCFDPACTFYISRGETSTGIARAYDSYASAVTLMQSSFFFNPGTLFTPEENQTVHTDKQGRNKSAEAAYITLLSEAVLNKDQKKGKELLLHLYVDFYQRREVSPHEAKDLYYKLFMVLEDCRQTLRLAPVMEPENAMKLLESCFSFRELHQKLTQKTELLFEAARSHMSEDTTIFLIKEYIHNHYHDDALSVRDIGGQVYLSASYVCTYFKNETGQTINQYLTDYRMKKAKELLADSRYQIADISNKVGYSNGNYFSKSFKKMTGLSPSDYREKMLK